MQHKVKVTVIDKKLYPELQSKYCANPNSGMCPCYNIGDEFIFERYGSADDFWHMGLNTLKQSVTSQHTTAGGNRFPHCSEAWDAISRYIYTALQGGSIMRGWMNDERVMIACCSDGTRPVIFKIERLDYKAVYINGICSDTDYAKIKQSLKKITSVTNITFQNNELHQEYIEVFVDNNIDNHLIENAINSCGQYQVLHID
ncbi:TIGR04076 family protein [Clostridium sp. MD294]|uniref:TIGR04076 family protein n=1 Tax=Clostridium sp. MD294 TaxID=97138 RepID=UPI0002CC75C6|nr:TIGR04076 family protein [Clostridium sp. MD294]NDO46657.1 TIGR04076 family protein [Clostridium sp. MD294]USF28910.1 hypothetical protein C820_000290 [Clostridium sp. MD294]